MINKVILVGRLGRDPELRHTSGGSSVCSLAVATTERYKDKAGEQQERTEWHRVTLWSRLADIANQYLHKGDQVYIEGRLETRSYEKDGVTHYATDVIARELKMLGGKGKVSGDQRSPRDGAPSASEGHSGDRFDDDIPF